MSEDEWEAVGRRLDYEGRRAKVDFIVAALLGAEQLAERLGEEELRRRISTAVAEALQTRLAIVQAFRDERRRSTKVSVKR